MTNGQVQLPPSVGNNERTLGSAQGKTITGGPPSTKNNMSSNSQNYWVKSQSLTEGKGSAAAQAAASMFADPRGQAKMNLNLAHHQQQMAQAQRQNEQQQQQHKISSSAGLVHHQRSDRNLPEIATNQTRMNAQSNAVSNSTGGPSVWQQKQTPQSSLNHGSKTAPDNGGLAASSMAPPIQPSHSETGSVAGAGGTANSWKLQAVAKTSQQNVATGSSASHNKNGVPAHQHQSADEAVKGASAGSMSKNYRQLSRDIAIIDGMVTPTLNNKYKLFSNGNQGTADQHMQALPGYGSSAQSAGNNGGAGKQPYRISALNLTSQSGQNNGEAAHGVPRVGNGVSLPTDSRQHLHIPQTPTLTNEKTATTGDITRTDASNVNVVVANGAPQANGGVGNALEQNAPQYIQLKDFRHQQHATNGVLAGGNGVGSGIAGGTAAPALGSSPKPSANSFDVRFAQAKQKADSLTRSKQTFDVAKHDSRIRRLQNVETKFDRVASGTSAGPAIPSALGATGQALTGAPSMIVGAHERRRFVNQGGLSDSAGQSPYQFQGRNPGGQIMIAGQRTGTNPPSNGIQQMVDSELSGFGISGGRTASNGVPMATGSIQAASERSPFMAGGQPLQHNQAHSWLLSKSGGKLAYHQQQAKTQPDPNSSNATNSTIGQQPGSSYNAFTQSVQGNLINRQAKQRMITSNNSSISHPAATQQTAISGASYQYPIGAASEMLQSSTIQGVEAQGQQAAFSQGHPATRMRSLGGQQSSTVVSGSLITQPMPSHLIQQAQLLATGANASNGSTYFSKGVGQPVNGQHQAIAANLLTQQASQQKIGSTFRLNQTQAYAAANSELLARAGSTNASTGEILPTAGAATIGDTEYAKQEQNRFAQAALSGTSGTNNHASRQQLYPGGVTDDSKVNFSQLLQSKGQIHGPLTAQQIDQFQFNAQNNQQQISSTLFIMDCQTFGIFNNQKLLKLSNIRAQQNQPQPETHTPQYQYTEAQIVNFVMNRALTSQQQAQQQQAQGQDPKGQQTYQQQQLMMIPKELPKLSEDAKRILTTIKAQQHLTNILLQESQKLDTLIIELDYYDYKNQLLQQLFHHYGNRVLSNLVHKITQHDDPPNFVNFQRVEDYVEKVRKMQEDRIKQRNAYQQKLFSQINDLSSGNEIEGQPAAFHSVDGKNGTDTDADAAQESGANGDNRRGFAEARKSEGLLKTAGNVNDEPARVTLSQSERKKDLTIGAEGEVGDGQPRPEDASPERGDDDLDEVSESDLQNYAEEIQHLFPKYAVKERAGMREIQLDQSQEKEAQKRTPEGKDEAPQKEKKIKKLNFHVIVKNTRLYHALRFVEAYKRRQEKRKQAGGQNGDEGGDTERESSKVVMGAAATMSQYGNSAFTGSSTSQREALSTFVMLNDCSMLKFALYCFHVGIVNSVQQMMRQFFKHVFIVIKPGKKQLPDGTVQYLKELPQVDVDKINKYLIQTKIRKSMQHSAAMNAQMKGMHDARRHSQMGHQDQGSPAGRSGRDLHGSGKKGGYYSGSQYQGQGNNPNQQSYQTMKRQNGRYDSKTGQMMYSNGQAGPPGADKDLVRCSSLHSFKSVRDINSSKQVFLTEYLTHFNSQLSYVKLEGPAVKEATTIKVIHKPFTHLDNARVQKAFKIYNEFTQLIFKSKLQQILHLPETSSQFNREFFTKNEFNRVYKLAAHMGVKLPRKNFSTAIGRQPLIDVLKNHRQVALIKEQMIKFTHRVLNEENDFSQNFQTCVIQGSINTQTDKQIAGLQSPTKSQLTSQNDILNQSGIPNDFIQNKLNKKGPQSFIVCQQTPFYKYQIGFGNNHYLIKALMKQRPWFHQLQRDKNSMMNGVVKLDFDESQILWTQWRRPRVYDHTQSKPSFDEEFKHLLAALGPARRLYAVHNNANCLLLNYDFNQGPTKKEGAGTVRQQQASALDDKDQSNKTNRKQSLKAQKNQNNNANAAALTGPAAMNSSKGNADVRLSKSLKNGSSKMSVEHGGRDAKGSPSKLGGNQLTDKKGIKDAAADDQYSDEFEAEPSQQKQGKKGSEESQPNLQEMRQQLERCKRKVQRIYNRLEFNQHLNNKKALFMNMRNYYNYCCGSGGGPTTDEQQMQENSRAGSALSNQSAKEDMSGQHVFDTLPLTFHIKSGITDNEYARFDAYYQNEQRKCQQQKHRKNIWIIKPGENSNRGNGIKVESELNKIKALVHSYTGGDRTMILQKYIDNPLLYQRRKFDIRCFSLVTCINGVMKGYFYRDGYIRTASKEYSMNNLQNKYIHLVNDAVQKYSEDYGKYEAGNKLSYGAYQKYLTATYPDKKINLERDIILQVRKIVTDTIRATFHLLDSKKRLNSYELFGYDFMFDDQFKPFLIEVNSNPSLEPSSNLLTKLFTQMLDNTFRIAIDPLFPPQDGYSMKKGSIGVDIVPENRFDLIFDERVDGTELKQKFANIGQKEREEIESINELEGSECGDDDDDNPHEEDLEQEKKANEAVEGVMAEVNASTDGVAADTATSPDVVPQDDDEEAKYDAEVEEEGEE